MMKSGGILPGLVAGGRLFSLGLAFPGESPAQSATDLKCRGCVGARDIGKNAVRAKYIRNNQITSAKIRNGTIKSEDLDANVLSGMQGSVLAYSPSLDDETGMEGPTNKNVRSVTVSAPSAGRILVIATYNSVSVNGGVTSCSITTGTTVDTANLQQAHHIGTGAGGPNYLPGNTMRVYDVDVAGTFTYNLICQGTGANDAQTIRDITMSALFVPGAV